MWWFSLCLKESGRMKRIRGIIHSQYGWPISRMLSEHLTTRISRSGEPITLPRTDSCQWPSSVRFVCWKPSWGPKDPVCEPLSRLLAFGIRTLTPTHRQLSVSIECITRFHWPPCSDRRLIGLLELVVWICVTRTVPGRTLSTLTSIHGMLALIAESAIW